MTKWLYTKRFNDSVIQFPCRCADHNNYRLIGETRKVGKFWTFWKILGEIIGAIFVMILGYILAVGVFSL